MVMGGEGEGESEKKGICVSLGWVRLIGFFGWGVYTQVAVGNLLFVK